MKVEALSAECCTDPICTLEKLVFVPRNDEDLEMFRCQHAIRYALRSAPNTVHTKLRTIVCGLDQSATIRQAFSTSARSCLLR